MKNLFSHSGLIKFSKQFDTKKVPKELIERVYTSRLIGKNKKLVLHGGGNTSVKSTISDIDGERHGVIFVKGSGSDLETIKPEDFPAVKLKPLKKIINKNSITDIEMVNFLKKNLIDTNAPNPSVETLVHSSIEHKFIDHTHSNAILELSNRKNGKILCNKIFGKELLFIPYVMPGFILAKAVKNKIDKSPNIKGLLLYRHGIFTFGKTAEESYKRMIHFVSKAEKFLKKEKKRILKVDNNKPKFQVSEISPLIRGAISDEKKYILNFRSNKKLLETIKLKNINSFLRRGVVTPDHVIRIKPKMLVLNISKRKTLQQVQNYINKEVKKYKKDYSDYFKKYNRNSRKNKILDLIPKIIVVPNLGIFSVGKDYKDSIINGDIGEMAISIIGSIERKANFESIKMKDIFDVEYWSLEQAKIGKDQKPLTGTITIVTGGLGTIGQAISEEFKSNGSEIIILENNKDKIMRFKSSDNFDIHQCDVRKRAQFKRVIDKICMKYGGIDYVISNAGNAIQHEISTISDKNLYESFKTNLFSHQIVASESVKILKAQGIGGCLLFNISKQSVNPGKFFGAYGLPKTALLALCKQYALEYGEFNIRSNGVNADRIISGILSQEMLTKRAKARGVSIDSYLKGNLLKKQVSPSDVAKAFYHLANSEKTTAAVLTVDGGSIESSLR